jgi:hypothetical protein
MHRKTSQLVAEADRLALHHKQAVRTGLVDRFLPLAENGFYEPRFGLSGGGMSTRRPG